MTLKKLSMNWVMNENLIEVVESWKVPFSHPIELGSPSFRMEFVEGEE